MYLATVRDPGPSSGIRLQWCQFSALPTDLVLPAPVANGMRSYYPGVHIFPYGGHLFISHGRAVWRKEHRNPEDPELANGVNDYSSMYHSVWDKVGDEVLPAADLRNVVPFFEVTAAGQTLNPKLVVLHEDNRTISVVNESTLTSASTWAPLTYRNNVPGINTQWEHIAYWNGKVVATTIDGDGKTYSQNLHLNLGMRNYAVSNKAEIEPLVELTATEVGPVAVQADGTMRLRRIDEDLIDGDETVDATIPTAPEHLFDKEPVAWDVLAGSDGVTNVGIGSAGVRLDLGILTRVLRLRYIDSQTALYPVMVRFRAFAQTHKLHLQCIKTLAEGLPSSGPGADDVTLATRVVSHARQWSNLLATNVYASNETVVLMARQLDSVQEDIELQLSGLRDELDRFKSHAGDQSGLA